MATFQLLIGQQRRIKVGYAPDGSQPPSGMPIPGLTAIPTVFGALSITLDPDGRGGTITAVGPTSAAGTKITFSAPNTQSAASADTWVVSPLPTLFGVDDGPV